MVVHGFQTLAKVDSMLARRTVTNSELVEVSVDLSLD